MLRKFHSLPGLWLALMLAITATTGAILAFDAATDAATAPAETGAAIDLAGFAERITARLPDVEKITRTPTGRIRVTYAEDGLPRTMFVDPASAEPLGPKTASPTLRTITNLHRAWLGGDVGRLAAGLSALAMLALTLTGLVLLKRQLGGWAKLARPIRLEGARRWHLETGRFAMAGLLLSAATGLYLSLAGFELVPDGTNRADVLVVGSGAAPRPLGQLAGLAQVPLADLRELTLPYAGDATDPITLKTATGLRHIDAATGAVLADEAHPLSWQIHDLVYRLHTAHGMAWLALLLGLSALAGSLLCLTGILIWLSKRRGSIRIAGSRPATEAGILLLVGSDSGTTWGFARTLHRALTGAGHAVHVAAMNDLPEVMPRATRLIVLAATAGTGEAPATATAFLNRLSQWQAAPLPQAIVLGFGDRQFQTFCGYADKVEAALLAKGIRLALPTERIDRQSVTAFAEWGARLAAHLNTPFALDHRPERAATSRFQLVEREDYGMEVQAPTAILRFRPVPARSLLPGPLARLLQRAPRFAAGDLVGICPPEETRPRLYSIASASTTGLLEICVRRQPGGACSGFLHGLMPGDVMDGVIRPHPAFRPDASRRPLVLIGAGTGIAPLVGFIRETGHRRPVHLYWGGRNPASDALYRDELEAHVLDGRISGLNTIFSRIRGGGYVQNLLTRDAALLRSLVGAGAQILICGGADMAEGVHQALAAALAPLGLDLTALRQTGKLIEDVY